MSRRRLLAAVLAVGLAACTSPADDVGDASVGETLATVRPGALTACVALTPRLVEVTGTGVEGYDVEVLRHVADALGLPLEVEQVSYDDLLSGAAFTADRCDVGAGGVDAEAVAAGVVRASVPYRVVDRLVVAVGAGPADALAPREVTGTVAVEDGGVADAVSDSLTAAEVVRFPSLEDLRRAVRNRVVDAALLTAAQADDLSQELGALALVARVPSQERTVLVLSQGVDEALYEAVDAALGSFVGSTTERSARTRWLTG